MQELKCVCGFTVAFNPAFPETLESAKESFEEHEARFHSFDPNCDYGPDHEEFNDMEKELLNQIRYDIWNNERELGDHGELIDWSGNYELEEREDFERFMRDNNLHQADYERFSQENLSSKEDVFPESFDYLGEDLSDW